MISLQTPGRQEPHRSWFRFKAVLFCSIISTAYAFGFGCIELLALGVLAVGLITVFSAATPPVVHGNITIGAVIAFFGVAFLAISSVFNCENNETLVKIERRLIWRVHIAEHKVGTRVRPASDEFFPHWDEWVVGTGSRGTCTKLPWQSFVRVPKLRAHPVAFQTIVTNALGRRPFVVAGWFSVADPKLSYRMCKDGDLPGKINEAVAKIATTMFSALGGSPEIRGREPEILRHSITSVLVTELRYRGIQVDAVSVEPGLSPHLLTALR